MSSARAAKAGTPSTQADYVLLALLECGGADGYVDRQDLAVAAYRLAPHLFGWPKYPEYPSEEVTRRALRTVEQRRGSVFLRGPHGRSIRLNAKGVAEAKALKAKLGSAEDKNGARVPARPVMRGLLRLEKHLAYSKWREGGSETLGRPDLADLLICAPNAGREVFEDRLEADLAAAATWRQPELEVFLADIAANMESILGRDIDV